MHCTAWTAAAVRVASGKGKSKGSSSSNNGSKGKSKASYNDKVPETYINTYTGEERVGNRSGGLQGDDESDIRVRHGRRSGNIVEESSSSSNAVGSRCEDDDRRGGSMRYSKHVNGSTVSSIVNQDENFIHSGGKGRQGSVIRGEAQRKVTNRIANENDNSCMNYTTSNMMTEVDELINDDQEFSNVGMHVGHSDDEYRRIHEI